MRKIATIILLAVLFTGIPIAIVWAHHQFVTGLNPFLAAMVTPFMLLVALLIYRLLAKIVKPYISFTPGLLFTIGFISYLFLFFGKPILYGNTALDIPLHDTYYVISYAFPFAFVMLAFAIFAATYHWFDKIFKRQLNYTLGYIHFWISLIGTYCLLIPMHYVGLVGMPRRYIDYSNAYTTSAITNQGTFMLPLVLLLIIAQLLFVINLCYSIFRKPRQTS